MKKLTMIFALNFVMVFTYATSGYEQAMEKALTELNAAQTVTQMSEAGNTFDRIASGAEDHWLPVYYGAYTRVISAAMEADLTKKDAYLDVAESRLKHLTEIQGYDSSEVLTLKGFLYMIRITVDPATRGQEYSIKASTVLQEAVAANPQNPRALLMLAQMNYGSAQFFNQDTSGPCSMIDSVLQLLDQQDDNPEADFAPHWGRYQAEAMKSQCNG